jgi:prevent-host-death family protein
MSATEARVHLGEVMRWVVENRRPVIVERGGKPHVVVISADEYEELLAGRREKDNWRDLVEQARAQIQEELGGRDLPPVEDILRQVREERDARLMALR